MAAQPVAATTSRATFLALGRAIVCWRRLKKAVLI